MSAPNPSLPPHATPFPHPPPFRSRQPPVVAPGARTREVIEWHQFDSGYAGLDERRQTLEHAQETAAGTDMQVVQHGFVPWASPPVRGLPRVRMRVDDAAVTMHIIGLRA